MTFVEYAIVIALGLGGLATAALTYGAVALFNMVMPLDSLAHHLSIIYNQLVHMNHELMDINTILRTAENERRNEEEERRKRRKNVHGPLND